MENNILIGFEQKKKHLNQRQKERKRGWDVTNAKVQWWNVTKNTYTHFTPFFATLSLTQLNF